MKLIGNLIWFFVVGLASAVSWFLLGVIWCITIIGIPFGKQCFKIAGLMLWPFGKRINADFSSHPIANIIWLIFGGLELGIAYAIAGIIFCITIVYCYKLRIPDQTSYLIFPFNRACCI